MSILRSIVVFLGTAVLLGAAVFVISGCSEKLTDPLEPDAFDESIVTREDLKSEHLARDDHYSFLEDLPTGGGKATLPVLDNDRGTGLRVASCDCQFMFGTVTVENNALVLTVDENVFGSDVLQYVAVDSDSFGTAHVTIEILPVNDAPVANETNLQIELDQVGDSTSQSIGSLFTDPEGGPLTYKLDPSETINTIVIDQAGALVHVKAEVPGSEFVNLIAIDDSLSESEPILITIMVGNRPPVNNRPLPTLDLFVGQSETVPLGDHFEDPDGDPVTYSATAGPNLELTLSSDNLVVKGVSPTTNEPVEITASDGQDSTTATIMVNVLENLPPIFIATDAVDVHKRSGTEIASEELFSDDLSAMLSLILVSGPGSSLFSAQIVVGGPDRLVITTFSEVGTDSVTIGASDGFSVGHGRLVVRVVNQPPTAEENFLVIQQIDGIDTTLFLDEQFSDADDDPLTFLIDTTVAPGVGSVVALGVSGDRNEMLSLNPVAPGTAQFRVGADDGDDLLLITVTVQVAVNLPPLLDAALDTISVRQDTTINLTEFFVNTDHPRDTLEVISVELVDDDPSISINVDDLPNLGITISAAGVDTLNVRVRDKVTTVDETIIVEVLDSAAYFKAR